MSDGTQGGPTLAPPNERSVFTIRRVVLALPVIYVGVMWVGGFVTEDVTTLAAVMGQAGDFMGGLLNPLVAYTALIWLASSVEIQRTELVESRRALRDAAAAQSASAIAQAAQVRLAALTASLNAASQEEQLHLTTLTFYLKAQDQLLQTTQRVYGLDGEEIVRKQDVQARIKDINGKLRESVQTQERLRKEIESYVLSPSSDIPAADQ